MEFIRSGAGTRAAQPGSRGGAIRPTIAAQRDALRYLSNREPGSGGRRLAYVSDESGRTEVWVRSFPGRGPAMQVSVEGGYEPVWSPDGKELFFRRGTSFFSVDFEDGAGLRSGSPREMFRGRYDLSPTGHQHFDIDSEGHRFAAIALGQAADPDALHLVLDWGRELDRAVPGRR